jgi:arsenite methyltransferase
VSGALAERDFVHKIEKIGFTDLAILERRPFSIDDAESYPLFTPDLIELMRELIPPDQQDEVATVVTLTATKPQHEEGPS